MVFKQFTYVHLQQILNSLPDGIFIADQNGVAIWMNDASTKQLGASRSELIGKNVDELERKGFFTPSVTKDVLKERKPVSKVQKSQNRQYLASGKLVHIPPDNTELVVVQVKDITATVRASLELENAEYLLKKYWEELQQMKKEQMKNKQRDVIIGTSKEHEKMMTLIDQIAPYDATVLLQGETGVGKSFVAKEIHYKSDRADQPFMHINCAAIPENLLESELFGYKKGAFTGASHAGKKGLVEQAHGGTLFLDEIAEIPLPLQSKILQLVQDKTFIPIGGTKPKEVDIRIIAATNADLLQMIKEKRFREDLYYRLNVVSITIPPLRERQDDILPLLYHYLNIYALKYGKNVTFTEDLLHFLQHYDWPGNIRELENMVERLVVTATSQQIDTSALPEKVLQRIPENQSVTHTLNGETLPEYLSRIEKMFIQKAQKEFSSTRAAAKFLGLTQSSYMRRLKKYGLTNDT